MLNDFKSIIILPTWILKFEVLELNILYVIELEYKSWIVLTLTFQLVHTHWIFKVA